MNDQNGSIWEEPGMDEIRAILDHDYEQAPEGQVPRQARDGWEGQAPAAEAGFVTQTQPEVSAYDQVYSGTPAQFGNPAESFRNPNPMAAPRRPAAPAVPQKPRKKGRGTVVFLILLILLELGAILAICTSWYLWTH